MPVTILYCLNLAQQLAVIVVEKNIKLPSPEGH